MHQATRVLELALPNSSLEGIDIPALDSPSLSLSLFNDPGFSQSFSEFAWRPMGLQPSGDALIADNPYGAYGEINESPLLKDTIKQLLGQADSLQFSTPLDNKASGEQPDYRAVVGTDGKLRLEPVG